MQDFNRLSKNLENFEGLVDLDQNFEIYLFIKKNFKSKGDVIELGTFLGKTTKTICQALPESYLGKIYTYDNFIWNSNHKRKFPRVKLNVNQNFLDYVKNKINSNKVIFKKGLIQEIDWDGNYIELLVLDAPKNFDEINDIFFKLSPFFKKNITKIIFLDFNISIKYDTQIFLDKISGNFLIQISKSGIAFCTYVKEIDFKKFGKFLEIKKMKSKDIRFFWDKNFKSINDNLKKRLSLLPALHLYDNRCYYKSIKFIFCKNVHVQKKYILIKYMIKRYPLLIPVLLVQFLRGKYFI